MLNWEQFIDLQKTPMRSLAGMLLLSMLLACGRAPEKPAVSATAEPKAEIPQLLEQRVDPVLAGNWELDSLPQAATPLNQLYPRQRPALLIQPEIQSISGSTGCNRFSASLATTGDAIRIGELTRSTLVCVGDAETEFLKALSGSVRFTMRSNKQLVMGSDSVTWAVFKRKDPSTTRTK